MDQPYLELPDKIQHQEKVEDEGKVFGFLFLLRVELGEMIHIYTNINLFSPGFYKTFEIFHIYYKISSSTGWLFSIRIYYLSLTVSLRHLMPIILKY